MLFYYATPFKIVWILATSQQLHFLIFPRNLIFKRATNSLFSPKYVLRFYYFSIRKCGKNNTRHFTNLISCVKVYHPHFTVKKRLQNSIKISYLVQHREGLPKGKAVLHTQHHPVPYHLPHSVRGSVLKSGLRVKGYTTKVVFCLLHLFYSYCKYGFVFLVFPLILLSIFSPNP